MALATMNFYAKSLRRFTTFNIIIPSDKIYLNQQDEPLKEKPYKTLYLLHGLLNGHTIWDSYSNIQALANDYNLCVVMPAGENKFYVDSEVNDEYHCKLIGEELVKFTRQTFNLSDKREDTFIGGYSMGGYGALIVAFNYPETFSKVIGLSSGVNKEMILTADDTQKAFFTRKQYENIFGVEKLEDINNSKWDYNYMAKKIIDDNKPLPDIFLACGKQDFLNNYNVKFKNYLLELGYDVTWLEGEGEHNWDYWNPAIKKAIEWLNIPLDTKSVRGGKLVL
ncbi:MAG: esterase family protein [Bacilli bacterium]|jgi:S-formylglutathione hydrolase FrmB|nr:esterase family protein [Bacilli bacterium]